MNVPAAPIVGVLLAVLFLRFALPIVLRYEIGAHEVRLVLGPLVLARISLGDVARARRPSGFEIVFARRVFNRVSLGTVFLEGAEGSSLYPGILISPPKPDEFMRALQGAGVPCSGS